jgi:pimeloyl-ACP methyl ester carboxylesterase
MLEINRDYFQFRNLRLSYLVGGEPKKGNIIIVHANGYSGGCYSYIIRNLAINYRVYALDFSGHGFSESTMDFKNWLFFRDQLMAFINHLKLEKIIGIGHSVGAAAWLTASKLFHGKVEKLILFDPTILNIPLLVLSKLIGNPLAKVAEKRRKEFKNKEQVEKIFRRFPAFSNWDKEIFQDYLANCLKETPNGIELACDPQLEAKIFNSLTILSPLKYLYIPTESHIIIPQKYEVCSPRTARQIARGNSLSTVLIMPGFSHFFPFEEKEWILNRLNHIL